MPNATELTTTGIDDLLSDFARASRRASPPYVTQAEQIAAELRRQDADRTDLARRLELAEAEIRAAREFLDSHGVELDYTAGWERRLIQDKAAYTDARAACTAAGVGAGGEKGGDGA